METIRTIKIHAQEIIKDKQRFISCSAEINGKWYKIKFTKAVTDAPRDRGLYDLTIDFDECSIEQGKQYTNKNGKKGRENDTIWVKHIVGIRKVTDEELKAINREKMSAIFGE